ncbi:MAG: hypothetical protein AABY15_07470 [Nanoarchaeota archaeon]
MDYLNIKGLELLVNLDINLSEKQTAIFKQKFDYIIEIYKEKHTEIDYIGLIQVTAVAYSYVNNEKNPDEKLQTEFYERLKINSLVLDISRRSPLQRGIIPGHTMN